jgi:hypothetical protein
MPFRDMARHATSVAFLKYYHASQEMDGKTGAGTAAMGPHVMKYNAGRRRARLPSRGLPVCMHFAGSVGRLCSMLIKNNTARQIYIRRVPANDRTDERELNNARN